MHRGLKVFAVVALAAATGACQSVPATSLHPLASADPLAIDPAGVRAAVVHPPGLAVPEGAAVLTLVLADADGQIVRREEFTLVRQPPGAAEDLRRREGDRATVLALAGKDVARFARLQEEMRRRRRETPGESSLAVHLSARPCRTGAAAAGGIVSYLRLGPNGRFLPVGPPGPLPFDGEELPACRSGDT